MARITAGCNGDLEMINQIPAENVLRARWHRLKRKEQGKPGQPKNFDEFVEVMPKSLKKIDYQGDDKGKQTFLIFNGYVNKKGNMNEKGPEYATVFVSEAGLKALLLMDTWVMDGTFDVAPKFPNFGQLFVIVAEDKKTHHSNAVVRSAPLPNVSF